MTDLEIVQNFMEAQWAKTSDEPYECPKIIEDCTPFGDYSNSWDWLMPVYMECQEVAEQTNGELLKVFKELFHGVILFNNINWVYNEVVEFIKWYNENIQKYYKNSVC